MKKTFKRKIRRQRRTQQRGKGFLPDIFLNKTKKIHPNYSQHSDFSQKPNYSLRKKPEQRGRKTRRIFKPQKGPTNALPLSWYHPELDPEVINEKPNEELNEEFNEKPNEQFNEQRKNTNRNKSKSKSSM